MKRVYLFSDGLGQSELGWDGDGEGSDGLGQRELGWDGDEEGLPFL